MFASDHGALAIASRQRDLGLHFPDICTALRIAATLCHERRLKW